MNWAWSSPTKFSCRSKNDRAGRVGRFRVVFGHGVLQHSRNTLGLALGHSQLCAVWRGFLEQSTLRRSLPASDVHLGCSLGLAPVAQRHIVDHTRLAITLPPENQPTVAYRAPTNSCSHPFGMACSGFFLKPPHRQRCGRLGCFGHGPQLVGTIFAGQKENRKLVGMAGSQHHHSRLDVGEVTLVNFAVVCVVCDPQLRRPQSMAKTT